jgi:hypothetical protein
MPYFILGWDYTQLFWSRNWFLGGIFVVIMVVLNAYFVVNWRLFGYLESEDWDGLIDYLEHRVYDQKKQRSHEIKILINTYVVKSSTDGILKLEAELRKSAPRLIPALALQFGIPHLLKNDPVDMEIYYGELMKNPKCRDREWISWNYAFALMLQQKSEEAKAHLMQVARKPRNAVLRVLTLYLLDAYASSDQDVAKSIEDGKKAVQTKFSYRQWNNEVEKNKGNLQVLVLAKLIDEATEWIYPDRKSSTEVRSGTGEV